MPVKKIVVLLSSLILFSEISFAKEQDVCGILQGVWFNGKATYKLLEVPEAYHFGNGPQKSVRITNPEVLEGPTGSCICVTGKVKKENANDQSVDVITDDNNNVLSQNVTISFQSIIEWAYLSDQSRYGALCSRMTEQEAKAHQKKIEQEAQEAMESANGPG